MTFQGQTGIPWENLAQNIITRKDLRGGAMLLCYIEAGDFAQVTEPL